MSEIRVRLTFRNDLLQRLIDECELSLPDLANAIGISKNWLYGIKALRRSPYGYRGRGVERDYYNDQAIKCSAFFHVPPEVLFPDDIYRLKWPSRLEKTFPVERVAALVESDATKLRALPPHDLFEDKDRKMVIADMLEYLTPRHRRVIQMRFGLGGYEPHTLDQAGEELELSRERIRQIEISAIRKLRPLLQVGFADEKPIIRVPFREIPQKKQKEIIKRVKAPGFNEWVRKKRGKGN
jgi:RNA polymerase sigma factor (sigma-70 family)